VKCSGATASRQLHRDSRRPFAVMDFNQDVDHRPEFGLRTRCSRGGRCASVRRTGTRPPPVKMRFLCFVRRFLVEAEPNVLVHGKVWKHCIESDPNREAGVPEATMLAIMGHMEPCNAGALLAYS
jgi:hypothetical protein